MARNGTSADQDVAGELKGMIATLRRRKLFFAIAMDGRTPVIKTHMKKKPKTLRKEAKSDGGGPKGCSGEIALNGKVIELYCVEDGVPEAIGKMATKHFRENGLQFKVVIMPGTIEEPGDGPEEEETETPEAGTAAAGGAGEAATPEAATARRSAPAPEGAAPGAAAEEPGSAPPRNAGAATETRARTAEQDQLLSGLRDMKTMLQRVSTRARPEDMARMRKFGDLFKKAVKKNDARIGQKVLDGMRQLSQQVEKNALAAEKRSQQRRTDLKRIRGELQDIIRALS